MLLCSAHHRLLHHGAFHVTVEGDDLVFVSWDGEVIEPALRPQFDGVSEGVPRKPNCLDPAGDRPLAQHRPANALAPAWH